MAWGAQRDPKRVQAVGSAQAKDPPRAWEAQRGPRRVQAVASVQALDHPRASEAWKATPMAIHHEKAPVLRNLREKGMGAGSEKAPVNCSDA